MGHPDTLHESRQREIPNFPRTWMKILSPTSAPKIGTTTGRALVSAVLIVVDNEANAVA